MQSLHLQRPLHITRSLNSPLTARTTKRIRLRASPSVIRIGEWDCKFLEPLIFFFYFCMKCLTILFHLVLLYLYKYCLFKFVLCLYHNKTISMANYNRVTIICMSDGFQSLGFGYFVLLFSLHDFSFSVPVCRNSLDTSNKTVTVFGDYSSAAEFYVFVGVTTFLFTLVAIFVYVIYDATYQNSERLPAVVSFPFSDLIVSGASDCLCLDGSWTSWRVGNIAPYKYL